jgi:hypothetical protein
MIVMTVGYWVLISKLYIVNPHLKLETGTNQNLNYLGIADKS